MSGPLPNGPGGAETCGSPCLTLAGVTKSFEGLCAVKEVSLSVVDGEHRAILGPNGAGKTTLFNLIAGDLLPTSGKISFRGEEITGLSPNRRAARGIARTFQITNLFFNLSIIDNLILGAQALERTKYSLFRPMTAYRHIYDRGMALLEKIGIGNLKDEQVRNLSYGVQRQVEILLALTGEPSLLLLDEPTAGLSPAEAGIMVEMLKQLPPSITILIIEHDMDVAFQLAQNLTVLHYGEVIADGTLCEVRDNRMVQEIYLGAKEKPC